MRVQDLPVALVDNLRRGMVIPAQPLALDANARLDERRQRALTRYYVDAGAGGIACGVHSTQFEIRDPKFGLFEPVLKLVSETADAWQTRAGRQLLKICGVCGRTAQARREAEYGRSVGYHAALVSLTALAKEGIPALLKHCATLSKIMPVVGFYLQPAVGGRVLPYEFWAQFAEIENVLAIKIAPFNRYQTLDVVRAICATGREKEIALYTGNDDNIIVDLLTEYRLWTPGGEKRVRIKGGLLGHWCVWTRRAVEQLQAIQTLINKNGPIPPELLSLAAQVTDANAAFFDAAHGFAGCIPGLHEVLRRQGLLANIRCLNSRAALSPGQAQEITRVYASYPHLNDDDFVRANLDKWLGN